MVTKILHTHSEVDIPFKVPCADRFCFWSCNRRPGCVLNCVAVGKTTLTNFWLKSIINTYSMITETEHQIYCGLLGPAQYFLRILIHDNNKISQNSHFDDAIDVNTALEFGRTVIAAWCPTSAPFICLFVDCPVNLHATRHVGCSTSTPFLSAFVPYSLCTPRPITKSTELSAFHCNFGRETFWTNHECD